MSRVKLDTGQFLSITQAAYVAGLTKRQLNQVIDERLVPTELTTQSEGERLLSVMGCAFANFYFAYAEILSTASRKDIIMQAHEVIQANGKNSTFIDEVISGRSSLEIEILIDVARIDLSAVIREVWSRMCVMCAAENLIVQDQSVMSGRPVFKGTRVPIDMIVDRKGRPLGLQEAQQAYSFLTQDHIDVAVAYVKLHPIHGRPMRLAEANPTLKSLGKGSS